MSHLAFVNGTVITPDRLLEGATVVCRDGVIESVGRVRGLSKSTTIIDSRGAFISPGFIDLHVHGGAGADFMDGTVSAVLAACQAHVRHGTTRLFPTTTTGSPDEILAMLTACQLAQAQPLSPIAGVHLYGPFFAADKVGCHAATGRRDPTPREWQRYWKTGIVSIATCAAELPGAIPFIKAAAKQGCLVTCGHSNASWAEMAQAFAAGMRHVDHFWCAMSSVPSIRQRLGTPMQGSMAEFVLMHDEMSTEVIADGYHLAPELLEFAYRMKGPERLCLVTDANRALDMPSGEYRFGHHATGSIFRSDGRVGWASGGSLASSVVGMDTMVRHTKRSTTASLPEVIRMASLTPAERAGIATQTGSIEPGKAADIVVLSTKLKVKQVFIGGIRVDTKKPR